MQIHELPTISGSPSGGYFATDNGTQTTKIDYTALAQAIIEQYNASTLAGSAQSVQAALNGLMQSAYSLDGGTIVESGFNWDTCLTVGNYYLPTTGLADASVGTKPIAHPIGFLKVVKIRETANYTSQLFYEYDDLAAPYARNYTANNQTWSEWVKLPTREEMTNSIHMGTSGSTWASTARLSADTDINQILVGEWFWSDATNRPSVNCPDNNAVRGRLWALDSGGGDYYCCQVCYTSSFKWFVRYCTSRSAKTWTAWEQMPTRAEVDALSSNTIEEIASDASSGTVNISRYGKIRILTFTDVVAAGNTISLSAALATTDRPRAIIGSVLFASDNSAARVWVRLAGTIGTTNVVSGKTYNGELVYIVA